MLCDAGDGPTGAEVPEVEEDVEVLRSVGAGRAVLLVDRIQPDALLLLDAGALAGCQRRLCYLYKPKSTFMEQNISPHCDIVFLCQVPNDLIVIQATLT